MMSCERQETRIYGRVGARRRETIGRLRKGLFQTQYVGECYRCRAADAVNESCTVLFFGGGGGGWGLGWGGPDSVNKQKITGVKERGWEEDGGGGGGGGVTWTEK